MTTVTSPRTRAVDDWAPGLQQLIAETVLSHKEGDRYDVPGSALDVARFAEACRALQFDPTTGQLYGVYRLNKDTGRHELSIQIGIDGWRTLAARHPGYAGQAPPLWAGTDGTWTEAWIASGPPSVSRATVLREIAGQLVETTAVATWAESADTWNGNPKGKWKSTPASMLAKAAEMLALRKAFPIDRALAVLRRVDVHPSTGAASTSAYDHATPPPDAAPESAEQPATATGGRAIDPDDEIRRAMAVQLLALAHLDPDLREQIKVALERSGATDLTGVRRGAETLPADQLHRFAEWTQKLAYSQPVKQQLAERNLATLADVLQERS